MWLENNNFRRGIRITLAIILALTINYFFSATHSFWLPLVTLFVMLTTFGSALYQGLLRFLLLITCIIIGPLLFYSSAHWNDRLYDTTLGALIGIICNIIILPDRADVEFRRVMVPIMQAYAQYFSSIIGLMLRNPGADADDAKLNVQKKLLSLPLWVFERGLDIALQKGHRYFFIKTTELSEILFAMHHLARYPFEKRLLIKIKKPLLAYEKKAHRLFNALVQVLQLQKLKSGVDDFSTELNKIEKLFKKTAKLSLELTVIDKGPPYLAEFIYDLHDLRDRLIQLAAALR